MRRDRVEVVLDEEHDRGLPGRREVHRFEHRADLARAVAEVIDRYVVGARVPLRPRVARGERAAAANDRIGAERTGLKPLQVHRAAAAAREALRETEDLGERPLQHRLHIRVDEGVEVQGATRDVGDGLGEELVVTAVRAVHAVGRAQGEDRADRAALLPDAGVRRSVHEPLAGEIEHGLLEGSNELNLAKHGSQQRGVRLLPVGRRGRELDPGDAGLQLAALGHMGNSI